MRKFLSIICVIIIATGLFAACDKGEEKKMGSEVTNVEEMAVAVIDVENYGKITVKLDAKVAPITVNNFVKLAESGFYNGLTFHRILKGFMIQGGDPSGDGSGGSQKEILGEFTSNGVNNPISHVRGTISMARTDNPNSASSQFFICDADSTFLDGNYAAFGQVTSGMNVVDKIADVPVLDQNGTVASDKKPVIKSITITEKK